MRCWPGSSFCVAPCRRLGLLGIGLLLVLSLGSAGAAEAPKSTTAAPPQGTAESLAELDRLVGTLQDDKSRAVFLSQLQALIAADRGLSAVPATEPEDIYSRLSRRFDALVGQIFAGLAVLLEAPLLLTWAQTQIANEAAREGWIGVAEALLIVFAAAFAAEWLIRLLRDLVLPRVMPSAAEGHSPMFRGFLFCIGIIAEILPIAAFAAVAMAILPKVTLPFSMARYGLTTFVEAVIAAKMIMAAAKGVLVPVYVKPTRLHVTEETRNYLLIWVRRFAAWGVYGYALAAAAWWLGVPGGVYALMLKIAGLVVAVLSIVFVLQNRTVVASIVEGHALAGSTGFPRVRRRLGEIWHVLAIVSIAGIYMTYALRVGDDSDFSLHAPAVTLAVIIGAQLLARFIREVAHHSFAIAPDLKTRFPELEHRANRYLPILTGLSTTAIYTLAVLIVLQAWDIRSFAWIQSELTRQTGGPLLSIVVVLAIALGLWEFMSAAIERHLASLDRAGTANRARRRTLLPVLRTAMLCLIIVVAALTVLSEIGVNIAPLIAGAGVIGVAIGFGSQALVKDIITGLSILAEDQIGVGDIVDLGKDHQGVVEAISIRSIRLRDQEGVVHSVPFSDVTSIKNMTKDFAFAVARIGIAYGENVDRVSDVLRGVSEELMRDREVAPFILDPFDYHGIDSLGESKVMLLLRVRTLPGKQFIVGRALNRLIKMTFEQHGVATP